MEFLLGFTAYFVIAFVLFPWIAGPIAVYLKNEMPGLPEFFPLTDGEIEGCTAPEFVQRSNAMTSLGFEQVANLQWITSGSRTFTRLFYRHSTQELANVTEITAYTQGQATPPVRIRYMEFTTEFLDGPEINTSSANLQAVYRAVPQKQIHYLPNLQDAAVLYRVHRHITGKMDGEIKPLPPVHLIEQHIQRDSVQTLKRQADAGYMYLDEKRSVYRPTIFGATIMAWKLLWPVVWIRRWNTGRTARQLLTAVGA